MSKEALTKGAKNAAIPVSAVAAILYAGWDMQSGVVEKVTTEVRKEVEASKVESDAFKVEMREQWLRQDFANQGIQASVLGIAERVSECEKAIKTPSPWDWRRSDQRTYMQRLGEMNDGLRVPPVPEADWPRWESAAGN